MSTHVHVVTAIWLRCTCARCGHVWRLKTPPRGMLDLRDGRCPTCAHTVFTAETLRLETITGKTA